ncbi:MAG: HD domain-containing protein [Peptococcaceae bacterium]|jgi:metal-dependent HD superfamily phosphatase/phosphodiesterase|nr:HD domain-containing protein [Peptococcaceae bacterium]
MQLIMIEQIRRDPEILAYIEGGNKHLEALGFTEHGFRHVGLVSHIARNILERMGFSERECELAEIAGFMHDIGNVINRTSHAQMGALLASRILVRLGMEPAEISTIIGAIGNHDEESSHPVNHVSAALILADKSDVHRTRVRNPNVMTFDIHDRVNYAVERSFLRVYPQERVTLELEIDTEICPVMDYFEIFLSRMILCRLAAEYLHTVFSLQVNGVRLL